MLFRSTEEEVENERIELCQQLQRLDSKNGNVYIDEISQIMQQRRLLKGIQYLEDVKIDFDINKVINEHKEVFNDNYTRFNHIGNLDIEYKALDSNDIIFIKKSFVESKKYDFKMIAFKELLVDYRDELAFGKYGLDQSLGIRVRHEIGRASCRERVCLYV